MTAAKRLQNLIYDAGCLPVVASLAEAWDAILMALFLAKDSDRLSLCSLSLLTINLWYSPASSRFCITHQQHEQVTCSVSFLSCAQMLSVAHPGLEDWIH